MNNESLFARMKELVAHERRIGIEILECLSEIEKRRAYAELKYDGLFTYCVKELGFTDSQAFQRIQAMRALKDLPELKPLIASGSLSVSAVSKVQTHFRKEKKKGNQSNQTEKLDLFLAMENKTTRQVEEKLAEVRGEEMKEKLILEMDEELLSLWERAKNLAAHRSRGDAAEVLKILARDWIERNDPSRETRARRKFDAETHKSPEKKSVSPDSESQTLNRQRDVPLLIKVKDVSKMQILPENRRKPSAALKRQTWKNGGGKCSNCSSRHAVEIDHIIPFACGGLTALENLRLLCRSCNQARAARTFQRQTLSAL